MQVRRQRYPVKNNYQFNKHHRIYVIPFEPRNAYARGKVRKNHARKAPTQEASSSRADFDHLQEVGSETEETGETGTRELVGGTLECGSSGGWRYWDNGTDRGASWGSCCAGLRWSGGRGDGRGEWHNSADWERTLGHSGGLACADRVGANRR